MRAIEYKYQWKRWEMDAGPPIIALRASVRRTSGSGCGGWPTPRTVTGGPESAERKQQLGRKKSGGGDLQAVCLETLTRRSGWRTPNSTDGEGGTMDIRPGKAGKYKLRDYAMTAGWMTPRSSDHKGFRNKGKGGENLMSQSEMAGYPTPTVNDSKNVEGTSQKERHTPGLPTLVFGMMPPGGHVGMERPDGCLGGWPTPTNSMVTEQDLIQAMYAGGSGKRPKYKKATMQKGTGLKLNPLFSLWLMGYPAEWAYCVVPEMR